MDSSLDDEGNFLSRWSRRKLKAKADAAADAAQAEVSAEAAPVVQVGPEPESPASELAESGVTPEYREFFDPQVDEKLRRTALRNLFSEPHFNVMDGLDTYIDDYSKPDPIPEAMLRRLNQAKNLFLFDDEKKAGTDADASVATGRAASDQPEAAASTGATAPPDAPASASGRDAGATGGPASAPSGGGSANG